MWHHLACRLEGTVEHGIVSRSTETAVNYQQRHVLSCRTDIIFRRGILCPATLKPPPNMGFPGLFCLLH